MSKKEYVLDSLFEDISKEDYNEDWCEHKEQVRNLLQKGLYGFLGGALIFGFLQFMIYSISSDTGDLAFSEVWRIILISLGVGIGCIGFPLGWELLNRLVGQWSIWGNLFIVVVLFVVKLAFALMIGMFTYPVFLIYHIIKSPKSKRKVRLWTIIVISIVALWYVFLGICAIVTAITDSRTNNTGSTEPPVVQIVDVTAFDNQGELVNAVCQKALESTRETEYEDINTRGWTITSPTQVHGIFYLDAKNPDNPYRNILKKLDVSNAIVVVTGYFLADAGITINQWEMDVWVYPNFAFDENGVLSYDTENVYNDSLRSNDMEDFMDWFSSEYSNMNITELNVTTD